MSAADTALHLSHVFGWRDDIPGAIAWHARSAELHAAAGAVNPIAEAEHAFVLIQARLMREAEELLTASIPRLEAAGDQSVAVQARLQLAEVLIARGAHVAAAEQVEQAEQSSPADGRYRFDIAAAGHEVRIAAGEASGELLDSIINTANEMDRNGERHAAALERFRGVRVALDLGDATTAAALCDDAARIVRAGPLWLQIQAWTALAHVRAALGNRRGAAAAVRAGLARLDEYRSGIGATDLRIRAAELAGLGQRLAVESGSVSRVFTWTERLRTASQQVAPSVPSDPALQEQLAQLRQRTSALRLGTANDIARLRREQSRQELEVRTLARQTTGRASSSPVASLDEVRDRLGRRVLVEFVATADRITAIVADSAGARLHAHSVCRRPDRSPHQQRRVDSGRAGIGA